MEVPRLCKYLHRQSVDLKLENVGSVRRNKQHINAITYSFGREQENTSTGQAVFSRFLHDLQEASVEPLQHSDLHDAAQIVLQAANKGLEEARSTLSLLVQPRQREDLAQQAIEVIQHRRRAEASSRHRKVHIPELLADSEYTVDVPRKPHQRIATEALMRLLEKSPGEQRNVAEQVEKSSISTDPLSVFLWLYDSLQYASPDGMQGSEIFRAVCELLLHESNELILQERLLDLLGLDAFDLCVAILGKKQAVEDALRQLGITSTGQIIHLLDSRETSSLRGKNVKRIGQVISVETENERKQAKALRKMLKKAGKGSEFLSSGTFGLSEEGSGILTPSATGVSLPIPESKHKAGLPSGATRKMKNGYEEVFVPAKEPQKRQEEDLVPITALEPWAQKAFPGVKRFNVIQSKIFDHAYSSNANMLVCAPTGAGKTNIAMLAILREIGQHLHGGVLHREEFKIIYVAPMKALAQEVVAGFSKRLEPLAITVRELTGDMQLTKREIAETQIIVTTPEKWDVITRKSNDGGLAQLVKLLIIDEVHLLHDERGSVIESIVARTIRQVEASQSLIRIVGLSATLPNVDDVAVFLRANPKTGLFNFDNSYRPVPLEQMFIGVTESNPFHRVQIMSDVCFEKTVHSLKQGHQVMVFVHSRKDTYNTALKLVEKAQQEGILDLFAPDIGKPLIAFDLKAATKSRNVELRELVHKGLAIHHAGMLRTDRSLVERMFRNGSTKVLVCTATLAWGVNLPAHTVIIKGTQVYNAKAGGFTELSILDVMQIFGRAGRPQFDTSGEGIIITSHDKLSHYLGMMNNALPIESQFIARLPDHLNAEIVLGTVSNLQEACDWLSYTYLYIRMLRNPMKYGLDYEEKRRDPLLVNRRAMLVRDAADKLRKSRMARFDHSAETFYMTDQGRIGSHYYISHESMEIYNSLYKRHIGVADLLHIVASSQEFENIRVRDEEVVELSKLKTKKSIVPYTVKGGIENREGKVNLLLQAYISRANIDSFTLISDAQYVSQSAGRILRGLFEMALKNAWPEMADMALLFCKVVDKRIWPEQNPLRQLPTVVPNDIINKLESRHLSVDRLEEMDEAEIGRAISNQKAAKLVYRALRYLPYFELSASVQPITRTIIRVTLTIKASFTWNDRQHGSSEPFWMWVQDGDGNRIYHSEYFLFQRKMMDEDQKLVFTIPVADPPASQYHIQFISDRWLACDYCTTLTLDNTMLPGEQAPHTDLLPLRPLPITALGNEKYEELMSRKFSHFNPVQTQAFHTLYRTDHNVLLGAPTGSGKTVAAELAMFRVFSVRPETKVIYIAPLKALVRERVDDWGKKLAPALGKKLVQLTGDFTPDIRALNSADIIIATPEKWDGISRSWRQRAYVRKASLIILDEIHLLGADRGPILEVIVSRMRFIAATSGDNIRFVGLSTALANAHDIADWLGVSEPGLFNFRPSVRPVPIEVHIQGFPGKHYCPRMASMNKPTYASIITHSPNKPVLVFVSSRRQTRLTAMDLMQLCEQEGHGARFLSMSVDELSALTANVRDKSLQHTLNYGIGLHHAGLTDADKELVERLFVEGRIQVLVSTSTLAWGVNFPAHLVVIKGTEYYDGKTKRYVDYPITDVLQMMGRAGRPQFDNLGKAVILVQDVKKSFYRKFLYEPFPVESSLMNCLHDHVNAEIATGSIKTRRDAIDYLTWTYFFRRLLKNPAYYNLEEASDVAVLEFLEELVDQTLDDLEGAGCVLVGDEDEELHERRTDRLDTPVESTPLGRISSFYYLQYNTVKVFHEELQTARTLEDVLRVLSEAAEFDELPVRHNEDRLNATLASSVRYSVESHSFDSPHVKAYLLLQAYLAHLDLPVADYITDTKSVLDQCTRVIQAMVDICADRGKLELALFAMVLQQCIAQRTWHDADTLTMVPGIDYSAAQRLRVQGICGVGHLLTLQETQLRKVLEAASVDVGERILARYPLVLLKATVKGQHVGDTEASPLRIKPGEDLEVFLSIERRSLGGVPARKYRSSVPAFCPELSKPKDEAWYAIVAEEREDDLLALKRISGATEMKSTLRFMAPLRSGLHQLSILCVSDSYVGLDHQLAFTVLVEE